MQRTKKAKYKKAKNKLAKNKKAKVQKTKCLSSKRWFSIGIQNIKVQCKEVTAGVVTIGQKNGYVSIYLEPEVVETWNFERMDNFTIGFEIKSKN